MRILELWICFYWLFLDYRRYWLFLDNINQVIMNLSPGLLKFPSMKEPSKTEIWYWHCHPPPWPPESDLGLSLLLPCPWPLRAAMTGVRVPCLCLAHLCVPRSTHSRHTLRVQRCPQGAGILSLSKEVFSRRSLANSLTETQSACRVSRTCAPNVKTSYRTLMYLFFSLIYRVFYFLFYF